jgi:manganese/zinc/iron transport system permease protein
MIAVVAGMLLLLAAVFSPKSGVLVRWLSQRKLSRRILGEDILALLYRESEQSAPALASVSTQAIADRLKISLSLLANAGREMMRSGYLTTTNGGWALTPNGYRHAQNLVRSHRLWEQFLSVETGLGDHRLHTQAESLEHYTSSELRSQLDRTSGSPSIDPHGKQIPPES